MRVAYVIITIRTSGISNERPRRLCVCVARDTRSRALRRARVAARLAINTSHFINAAARLTKNKNKKKTKLKLKRLRGFYFTNFFYFIIIFFTRRRNTDTYICVVVCYTVVIYSKKSAIQCDEWAKTTTEHARAQTRDYTRIYAR